MSIQDFNKLREEFQEHLSEFIVSADKLSKNSLKRVLKKLTAYPLEEDIVELVNKEERAVYSIGKDIQSVKINMMVESLKQDAEADRIREAKKQRISNESEVTKEE